MLTNNLIVKNKTTSNKILGRFRLFGNFAVADKAAQPALGWITLNAFNKETQGHNYDRSESSRKEIIRDYRAVHV